MRYTIIGMNNTGISLCTKLNEMGHNVTGMTINKQEYELTNDLHSVKIVQLKNVYFKRLWFLKKVEAVIVILEKGISKKSKKLISKLLSKIRAKKIFIHTIGEEKPLDILEILNVEDVSTEVEDASLDVETEHFIVKSFHY